MLMLDDKVKHLLQIKKSVYKSNFSFSIGK
jgi:hypothetical protein